MVKEWDCRWGTRASTRGTSSLMTCRAERRAGCASVVSPGPYSPACHLGHRSFLSSQPLEVTEAEVPLRQESSVGLQEGNSKVRE